MSFATDVSRSPCERKVHDVVGIGFGPSNISLAIALQELAPELSVAFVDSAPGFAWHKGMLFKNATMQVSFLKDLVSFRNPRSHFTFVNYLHSKGRIAAFCNKKDFFPGRVEFHDYLSWCAAEFSEQVFYGHRVLRIADGGVADDGAPLFRVEMQVGDTTTSMLTRSVVHSLGLEPQMPDDVQPGERVTHVHHLLARLQEADLPADGHCVVVGGGQSAAEAVEYLLETYPALKVTAIHARYGYTPADDSPFVNEIFDAEAVDGFHAAPAHVRKHVLRTHASTNYAAVDLALIEKLYRQWYDDEVSGQQRLTLERLSRFQKVQVQGNGLQVTFDRQLSGEARQVHCDYLVCATGFRPRNIADLLCAPLASRLVKEEGGAQLSRHYRLAFKGEAAPLLYSTGVAEGSHGLSATLISNMAIRAGEIVGDLKTSLRHRQYEKAV
ncbi:lysine N(6)-hydroxylase/L-ornithine N(5)-oxygenase family protein [Pseudomonas entomophila]|uniref:lysine N(6)-hydroxylase/L-ornithine N(5)-oxygenase family protein n=1 Tax=Pseudomonas entomophila TaxID=312306 RepID=UPI001BCCAB67|nr:SidA/IucD/PvdA family monooxygenase [Pseudomonas entomophila]QVM92309.1 lysine N(6)-hydroxylase/L-ornithine N(5)-oxygenase family protein [Pseudomonas entomophila]